MGERRTGDTSMTATMEERFNEELKLIEDRQKCGEGSHAWQYDNGLSQMLAVMPPVMVEVWRCTRCGTQRERRLRIATPNDRVWEGVNPPGWPDA